MVYGELLGMMIDELEFAFNVNGRREKMMEVAGAIIEQWLIVKIYFYLLMGIKSIYLFIWNGMVGQVFT